MYIIICIYYNYCGLRLLPLMKAINHSLPLRCVRGVVRLLTACNLDRP